MSPRPRPGIELAENHWRFENESHGWFWLVNHNYEFISHCYGSVDDIRIGEPDVKKEDEIVRRLQTTFWLSRDPDKVKYLRAEMSPAEGRHGWEIRLYADLDLTKDWRSE